MKLKYLCYGFIFLLMTALVISGCSVGSQDNTNEVAFTIVSTNPIDGGTASRGTLVEVVFSRTLNQTTIIPNYFYVTDSSGARVPGKLTYSNIDKKIIFTSDNFYQIGEEYTVYVTDGIESSDRVSMENDYIFNFTVVE